MNENSTRLNAEKMKREIEYQETLYREEIKKNSGFSLRNAIWERIKELRRMLEQVNSVRL